MEAEEALLVASAVVVIMAASTVEKKKKRRPRRWWRTDVFRYRNGEALLADLRAQVRSGHFKVFTRMSCSCFEFLLKKIAPKISKTDTNMREAISAQDRFAITLRFLASGDSYTSLQFTFRISKQAISQIVPEVCAALIEVLKDHIKLPTTTTEWIKMCNVFEQRWNLPHCIGAMDGKHVALQAPMNSSSEFFNYKGYFSIVLFALVDGDYNFLFVDIGCQGRISDGGIFNSTQLCQMMTDESLGLPEAVELPGRRMKIPYFIAADSAFALGENIMKPYGGDHKKGSPERIFNYRLSRARRVSENAFGILSSVFRVLRKPMQLEPEKAQVIVTTIVYLHNFLRKFSRNTYTPPGAFDSESENGERVDGSWRSDSEMTSMRSLQKTPRRSATQYEKIRDELANYCICEGALPWQNTYA